MYTRRRWRTRGQKLCAAFIVAFVLCNIFLATPAFASGPQAPAGANSCWPFWPICLSATSTPTSTPTPTPTPTHTPTPTPTVIVTVTVGTTTATPTPNPTGSPTSTPTATPTPLPPPIHLAASTSFTMKATRIVATNAHLSLLPDPLHPVLTFTSATITGLAITHYSFTLNATGLATGTGISIKTSLFQDILTALGSFTDKADLLILATGGTVQTLTMTNVSLQIDRYIDAQAFTVNGLHLSA